MDQKNKRISLYLPSLRGGGAERVMVTLANGFAEQGHRVDLVLAQKEGPYLSEVSESVRIVDLKARRVLTSLPRLVRYLWRARPDAMLSALNHANVVAIWARQLARAKTRLVIAEHSTLSASQIDKRTRRSELLPYLMRITYPKSDCIVAVSHGVGKDLSKMLHIPERKIKTIYNPIDIERIQAMSKENIEHPWLDDSETPVLIAVGRLTIAKDYPLLLRSFSKLLKKQDARLIILGEGELRGELETLAKRLKIKNKVEIPGFVENPYAWVRKADLFVLSSQFEGLPSSLIEALACGTPVVSTNCPSGPEEILEGGRWGCLVEVKNPSKMAKAMHNSLKKDYPLDLSTSLHRFSAPQVLRKYLNLLLKELPAQQSTPTQ